ncbi:unnamed protein product [Symbiodinium natans]|uniref:KHDC4/BBP-like KH-domain type I domain-containing protein n=1 Tax=Symbiodinium natans TaxID=878477 RepID=A0A812U7R2_9DINO|nr:unnamed protein product [Symbiodinium natans]
MAGNRLRTVLPTDMFTWVCGQQVKVKNTFLDDVLPEASSNESTLTAEAHTCPELTRRRSDAQSSSSGSHGAGQESLPPNVEMPNTLLTLSTPPATMLGDEWHLDSVGNCMGPVVEPLSSQGIDDFRRATRETGQLLEALQAMPGLPFADIVLSSHPPMAGHHAELACLPMLPEVAGPPAVLSTLPCQQEATYGAWKPAGADTEADTAEPQNSDSDKASPLSSDASPCDIHVQGWTTNHVNQTLAEAPSGWDGYAAKAKSKAKSAKKHNPGQKIWCHFFIDPVMLRNGFDVNKKLIGHGGANTKRIYEETGAKIRLRGRGSGHVEGDRGEAPVHLMLAVTSETRNQDNFLVALELSAQLLQKVTIRYPDFCKAYGIPPPTEPLFWVGELSQEALSSLSWAADDKVQIGKVAVPIVVDVSSPTKRNAKPRGPELLQ